MAKKIAESGVELIPNISEQRLEDITKIIDRISRNTNTTFNRIANSRGGVLGVGSSMLGVDFNPLTMATTNIVSLFKTLYGTVERLNNKFQDYNNFLMDETQKQNKALAIMGGNNEENNIMYRALKSQGINVASVYSNINERMIKGDLQAYHDMNKNEFITNLVNQARDRGSVYGKKYLEDMKLGELENLLYSQFSIGELKKNIIDQAKINGDDVQGSKIPWNARQGEQKRAIDFTKALEQNTEIKETVIKAGNTVEDNKLATLKDQYEILGEEVSKVTIAISNFNKSVDMASKFISGLDYLTTKNMWKSFADYLPKNNILRDMGDLLVGNKSLWGENSNYKNTDESVK